MGPISFPLLSFAIFVRKKSTKSNTNYRRNNIVAHLSSFCGDFKFPLTPGDFILGHSLLRGAGDIVSRTFVVRDVQTNFFLDGVNTEQSKGIENHEVGGHNGSDPADDPKNTDNLGTQKVGAGAINKTIVSVVTVGVSNSAWFSEETNSNAPPNSVTEVDRNSINGIIDFQLDEEVAGEDINPATNDSSDEGCPGGQGGAGE